MMSSVVKSVMLSLLLVLGVSFAGAATLTVGPGEQYATPCPAIHAAQPGDTIAIDYNNGIPYQEPPDPTEQNRSDCVWFTNNLTIVGVGGRPILDAANEYIQKGILDTYGANEVISNLELRNAATPPGQGDNGAGVRIEGGASPGVGGDVTIQFCYIHDNEDGVLTADIGPGSGGGIYPDQYYLDPNPYITFLYDEFAYNGNVGVGTSHNMYIGVDTSNKQTFNLEYSWSHDARAGHEVKTRSPYNNVNYNLITDVQGTSSFLLDFPLGGTTYVVGNALYKAAATGYNANKQAFDFRDLVDNGPGYPDYGLPNEDLHFVNNTMVLDPSTEGPSFVILSCNDPDVSTCAAPDNGPVLSVNAVVENNIFVGPFSEAVNQSTAVQSNNLVEANTPANLAALFADPSAIADLDFHLAAGSPAIQAGVYPPTDNTGAADPKALATGEYVHPSAGVARPTPSGSTMDEGAYSYPRVDTPPSPNLSYTQSVTTPGSGTITLTGLPTPPAGQYVVADFISENPSVLSVSSNTSATGTLTTTFSVCCAATTTVVPVDIYVLGAHLTANITVVPGPVTLQSITEDQQYFPQTTVHMLNAPSSPITVDLSSSDPSILAVPSSITVPAGALSAETGSEIGSLWGQSPTSKVATITATYAGSQVSLPVTVLTPHIIHYYCNVYDPGCDVVGGNTVGIAVAISSDFPAGGGPVNFYSDTPSVIPNQTFTAPAGNWYNTFNLATNAVTASTNVTLTVNVNGSTSGPYGGQVVVTVTPAAGTSIAVTSGYDQFAAVGTNFPNPLVVTVTNGGTPVAGATVTFAGTGVGFPSGAAAVTNSSGVAQVTAQPTVSGPLTVTATVAGAAAPAIFNETGNGGTPASVAVASGSGQSALMGLNFASPLVAIVKDANGFPVGGVTVTFAGTGVGFPSGNTAVTNGSGEVQVTAEPTAGGAVTATASVAGVTTPATFSETGTAVVGGGPNGIAIDAGGPVAGNYQADELYSGGTAAPPSTSAIDTSAVTNPAPQAVYQTQRYGPMTYTIPELTPGGQYTVRLHFAETYWTSAGQREFNVLINGTQVLTNFDIFAAAGAMNKAVVESFPATADSNGRIVIQFTNGNVDNATISGIEIYPSGPLVSVVSGSGQSAVVGKSFSSPLVVTVMNGSTPVVGTTVTFAGTGVSFPSGATAVTDSNGQAQVTAQPTATGDLTITASVPAPSTSASFSETGLAQPASIAAVSGSGQRAAVGTPFANPLVAVVEDANGNPASGETVTFAGSGVSFPSGAMAVTNSSGEVQVTAQPTATGNLAITASVAGVSTPASFSESATPQVILTSVTVDGSGPGTTVHLSTPATTPVVVSLSSSDPTVLFTPPTVTIPTGATSAETGTLLGSAWTPPTAKTAVLTAVYNGVAKTASVTLTPPTIEFFKCQPDSCKSVVGGNPYGFMLKVDGVAPVGGGTVQITSNNPAVFPNQTIPIPQGQTVPPPYKLSLNTIAVTKIATVNVTATYGSVVTAGPISITPPGVPASIAAVSGSGQIVAVNTVPFPNPLVVLVEDAQGNPALPGTVVTFAGSGISFPSGATAVTNSSGQAQVIAQPTATGALTVTASVSGVTTPASFSETGALPPASVAAVSGSGQTAAAGTAFASPLVVVVKNASGNPVANATVTFAGAGASFPTGATALTNSSGLAQVTAQAPTTALGAFTITATVTGVGESATFTEADTAGPPATIAVVSGSGQVAAAGTPFANPLVVVVKDAYSNLVSGVTVTFAGTGVSFPAGATAVTGSSGTAQVTADLTNAGPITVTASVVGVATPASFSEAATGTAIAINLSGPAAGNYVGDGNFLAQGATEYCSNNAGLWGGLGQVTIDTSGVTDPAPQAVYQTAATVWPSIGSFTCTVPGLAPNASYTVRLHFADLWNSSPGQREFNVLINGNQVLTNFDIFATAGAIDKAVVESFPATADSNGNIVIEYQNGAVDNAIANGIEVIYGTGAPSNLSATAASSTQINLSWSASSTQGVTYSVFRSTTSGFVPGSGNQIASGLSGLTYSDTTVAASTTYYYVVEAVGSEGPSPASNQASAGGVVEVDLRSGFWPASSSSNAAVAAVTDGGMIVPVNGTDCIVSGIAGANFYGEILAQLSACAGQTVTWGAYPGGWDVIFSAPHTAFGYARSPASGTDLSTFLSLTQATGASLQTPN